MFSTAELNLLRSVSRGFLSPDELAKALGKDLSQIYYLLRGLEKKDILGLENGRVFLKKQLHVQRLANLLAKEQSIIPRFAGKGLEIFAAILDKSLSASEIAEKTQLSKNTVFFKLRQAIKISLVKKEGMRYQINKKLWSDAYEFLSSYNEYVETIDRRVPSGATIYYKTREEIVFSYKGEFDATKTAFSAFTGFGIKIHTITNAYYLPKKDLSVKEVFSHACYVVQKEMKIQQLILLTIFYVKYKKDLTEVKNTLIPLIERVLMKEKVDGMPSFEEVQTRADLYNVNLEK